MGLVICYFVIMICGAMPVVVGHKWNEWRFWVLVAAITIAAIVGQIITVFSI